MEIGKKKKKVINDISLAIGTTIVLLANDAFNVYQNATGATPDNTTGLLTISHTQYNQLHNLSFLVSDVIISTSGVDIFIHPSFFIFLKSGCIRSHTERSNLASNPQRCHRWCCWSNLFDYQ
jgi:hypothetical protein